MGYEKRESQHKEQPNLLSEQHTRSASQVAGGSLKTQPKRENAFHTLLSSMINFAFVAARVIMGRAACVFTLEFYT